jgi:hypothetical protein
MPENVRCHGIGFDRVRTLKHDFFAATGVYRAPDGSEAVLKAGRTSDAATIPLSWIGRFLTRREHDMYAALQDLPGVPPLIGMVGKHGFLHGFVPGHPLGRDERVSDTFFDELMEMLEEIHRRDMAYVDLNKRQNILMGDDGKPYLIDFQISLHVPRVGWRGLWPMQWLLRRFQHADRYHTLKHKRRLRPDLLTEHERRVVEKLSFWIRLHRVLTRPLTNLRRRTLKRLSQSETARVVGSDAK